ncbi:DUF6438 domain-containing protein [Emticicia fontis]
MKSLVASLFLFIILLSCKQNNEIDKLQTFKQVNQFISDKIDKESFYRREIVIDTIPGEFYSYTDSVKYIKNNKFFKIDIDNNGLTDLLLNKNRVIVALLDKGNKKYETHFLNEKEIAHIYADSLISIDRQKVIVLRVAHPKPRIDTLIYKFDGFLEYNPKVNTDFNFNKMRFTTTMCYGICPVFEIIVNKDRTATYNAIQYNKKQGEFRATIPTEEFDELMALLIYLNLANLKGNYEVGWTDDQTATTQISYSGINKSIEDYGLQGTFGLKLLYKKMFDWRERIDWKK